MNTSVNCYSKILDYGCGSGIYKEIQEDNRLERDIWLRRFGKKGVYGIDINPENIKAISHVVSPEVKLIVADGRFLPFESSYFELVHDGSALHHIEHYEEGIKEIARVLKAGGVLILHETVDNYFETRLGRSILKYWRGDRITGRFTTGELRKQLSPYFIIQEERLYWRSSLAQILAMYQAEPTISLWIQDKISLWLNSKGLGETFCCHYVAIAIRR